jgi:predicted cobalt transporter CbtA
MVRTFLVRGMLVGVVAGLLSFAFLKVYGEPQVDRAIAFEQQLDEAKAAAEKAESEHQAASTHDSMHAHNDAHAHADMHAHTDMHTHESMHAHDEAQAHDAEEPELVSRTVQAGLGLFTAVIVYCAAFGGLFGLAFAFAYGRMPGRLTPQAVSALLAAAGFVAIYLVPNLKYPANPPAVGDPETIGARTALYFVMIAISLVAIVGATTLKRSLVGRLGDWNANLLAAACYIVIVAVAALLLPAVNEVPDQFPAVVLWKFRIASMGAQLIMWATLGLLFGALTQRAFAAGRSPA